MPAFDTFLLQELLIFRPKKVKNYHENRHFVGVVPKLMAFSNTCHLLTLLLQDLLIFRPKKVMNCHKNWHLIGRIHKLNLSHFGLKQMKLKSIVFSRGRGVAGRPAKGVIFYSSSCKVAFGHKNGGLKNGGLNK